jgi:hypothetical protein
VCAGSLTQAVARPAPLLYQIANSPVLSLPATPRPRRGTPLIWRIVTPAQLVAPAVILRI